MKKSLLAVLVLALATIARAQVVAPTALTYTWPAVSVTGQVGSYLIFSNLNIPRPSNYRLNWTDSGTAPSGCTFNLQGSADGVTWTNVDGGSAVSCTSSGVENVINTPVSYLRVNIVSYTAGDGTTAVVFRYTGANGSNAGGVTSLNNLTGGLTLAAGSNITITPSGNTLTIASSGAGSISVTASVPVVATPSPITGTGVVSCPTCTTSAASLVSGDVLTGAGSQALQDSGILLTSLAPLVSPSFTTPSLGVATATSINKLTLTAPATSATLTIPDGVTLTGPAASGTAATLGNAETISGAKNFSAPITNSAAGAASSSPLSFTGTCLTGGSGTTNFPHLFFNFGASPVTTWSVNCTPIGINAASGFTGNFLDFHVNAAASVFAVNQAGAVTMSGGITFAAGNISTAGGGFIATNGLLKGGTVATFTNCSSTASPAVCGSAMCGTVQVAAAATTLQVNTTAAHTASEFFFTYNVVGITAPTNIASLIPPYISAVTNNTNFTMTLGVAPVANAVNVHYCIFN